MNAQPPINSLNSLSHDEIGTWLERALCGQEQLRRLTPDESPHLGIVRLEKTLKPAARDSLRDACHRLVHRFCIDGRGVPAYVDELLSLTSAFKIPEAVQMLARLADTFPEMPQISGEIRLAILATIVDTPPPQPPSFWERTLKQDAEAYAGLALSGVLATQPAQAIKMLPSMPDAERAGQAAALKLDLTWDNLPPKNRFQFVQDIQEILPQCGSHFAVPVDAWTASKVGTAAVDKPTCRSEQAVQNAIERWLNQIHASPTALAVSRFDPVGDQELIRAIAKAFGVHFYVMAYALDLLRPRTGTNEPLIYAKTNADTEKARADRVSQYFRGLAEISQPLEKRLDPIDDTDTTGVM